MILHRSKGLEADAEMTLNARVRVTLTTQPAAADAVHAASMRRDSSDADEVFIDVPQFRVDLLPVRSTK